MAGEDMVVATDQRHRNVSALTLEPPLQPKSGFNTASASAKGDASASAKPELTRWTEQLEAMARWVEEGLSGQEIEKLKLLNAIGMVWKSWFKPEFSGGASPSGAGPQTAPARSVRMSAYGG